ncbi:MAG TPA: alpha-amylase family glycosyl hydrolase [Terracidiphilus sp.]|jgi:glycosidase|nr:alpha-amylase family glycosyl hydrolase [Terracidiphilus sp.]
MLEFHISRGARERYQFPDTLFSFNGNVVFANMGGCRAFAHRMNQVREADKHPDRAVHAGALFAMGLIDEASHVVVARYREQYDSQVMTDALEFFGSQVGPEELDKLLLSFVEHFPGSTVMRGEQTALQWLAGSTGGRAHREAALEELLMLWTANRNEAFKPFEELFEDKPLAEKTVYRQITQQLPDYFATRPLIPLAGAKPVNLLELLRAPATAAPKSLREQLELLRNLWKPLLGDSLERFLLIAGDILREEEMAIWMQFNPAAAQTRAAAEDAARRRRERGEQEWAAIASTADVPTFGDPAHEYEKFSPDTAWMPTTVMIAKSTYVWLAQLSKQYGRHIRILSDIPDEELAGLAHRGLNTLWLIGVWERSRASKTIKYLCGNQDAVASAYSLFDYRIADDIGGEQAYNNLRDRAFHHGIRLASDMVPNHMGIDSPWVVEHPEWFISRWESPYPAYSFEGPDLSADGRVEIKIDDHYFTQTDAAVVFRRRDKSSGETRYIYHGNDGTSFPWNDTAQLDYLNPAVREQVIQTILHVARLFPVIRFDAAMTLAKRHFHRLWFPGPGSSGAIPSRAEYGMSQAEFDRAMPHEFWREVVDRVAQEVPGTLLLAEAFWLMEGYFVRTLGMHRVYNSAFMVMTRDEDNAKYRSVIKNTLEFDPDIMKRYVNFMSNPDERTAIDQYGKGDKCFGVTVMMATLPGLPMFGHGQIEGFTEKYGMEYQRPRYDETPDQWLIERHEREIAPLLNRRWLFAESYNFLLYDFFHDSGSVDENVFAYSNRVGGERALIVYNNVYGSTHGTVRMSAAYADKGSGQLRQRSLWEGLGLNDGSSILAFRDSLTGLEYLRRTHEIGDRGLTLDLHAYQSHVFLDWRELYATPEKAWERLCDQLGGRGVPSLDEALIYLELRPVHDALRAALDPGVVRGMAELAEFSQAAGTPAKSKSGKAQSVFLERAWSACAEFLAAAVAANARRSGTRPALDVVQAASMSPVFRKLVREATRLPALEELFPAKWPTGARRMIPNANPQIPSTALWGPVLAWCVIRVVAEAMDAQNPERAALEMFDRLRLREPLAQAFHALGLEGEDGWRATARVKALLLVEAGAGGETKAAAAASTIAAEKDVQTAAAEALVAEATSAVPDESGKAEKPRTAGEELLVPPGLWSDPDICWLTGAHVAENHTYIVRELYEELLWWLLLPQLLRAAGSPTPRRADAAEMSAKINQALTAAESAGYRIDTLLGPEESPEPDAEAMANIAMPGTTNPPEPEPESLNQQEAVTAQPVGPADPKGPPETF